MLLHPEIIHRFLKGLGPGDPLMREQVTIFGSRTIISFSFCFCFLKNILTQSVAHFLPTPRLCTSLTASQDMPGGVSVHRVSSVVPGGPVRHQIYLLTFWKNGETAFCRAGYCLSQNTEVRREILLQAHRYTDPDYVDGAGSTYIVQWLMGKLKEKKHFILIFTPFSLTILFSKKTRRTLPWKLAIESSQLTVWIWMMVQFRTRKP